MRRVFLGVVLAVVAGGCDFGRVTNLTEPSQVYNPPPPQPAPTPTIQTILFGERVRFRFTSEDFPCGTRRRCLSYYVIPPASGEMEVVIQSTTANDPFFPGLELYIVPGADDWYFQEGLQIAAAAKVRAGEQYEIRMSLFSVNLPSLEFELRTSLY